jgi:predicted nucleic acid-binding protein
MQKDVGQQCGGKGGLARDANRLDIAESWAILSVPDPLPLIDGLLAATAKVHGLTLVTCNLGDIARTGVPAIDPFAA